MKRKRSERQKWIYKLDKAFSLYIRMRDSKEFRFRYFRCPTCGRVLPFSQADCSHYYSRRHMGTRYDEDNCVAECSYDNRFNSEHLIGLGNYIKKRIGPERFENLRVKANNVCKLSVADLQEMYLYYGALIIKMREEI